MSLKEIKTILYKTVKGASASSDYKTGILKDEQYPFIAYAPCRNQSMYFVSGKEADAIRSKNDIKLL